MIRDNQDNDGFASDMDLEGICVLAREVLLGSASHPTLDLVYGECGYSLDLGIEEVRQCVESHVKSKQVCDVLVNAWIELGRDYCDRIRSSYGDTLEGKLHWRTHVCDGAVGARLTLPTTDSEGKPAVLDLSLDQLQSLYSDMELIQSQLDSLN